MLVIEVSPRETVHEMQQFVFQCELQQLVSLQMILVQLQTTCTPPHSSVCVCVCFPHVFLITEQRHRGKCSENSGGVTSTDNFISLHFTHSRLSD